MKRIILAALVAVLAFAGNAAAQQTTGNIQGRITDAQGAAVPGVTVVGRNTATGFTRTEVADTEGIYRLNALPIGTYDITAELQGFSKFERKEITVSVGQTVTIDVTLNVAGVQESVTVTGETPQIETTGTRGSGTPFATMRSRMYGPSATTKSALRCAQRSTAPSARAASPRGFSIPVAISASGCRSMDQMPYGWPRSLRARAPAAATSGGVVRKTMPARRGPNSTAARTCR